MIKLTDTVPAYKSKRRDRLEIMKEIITSCRFGSMKTNIMFKCNLSFCQINQFICALLQSGLLEKFVRERKVFFVATPKKGAKFVKEEQELFMLLNNQ